MELKILLNEVADGYGIQAGRMVHNEITSIEVGLQETKKRSFSGISSYLKELTEVIRVAIAKKELGEVSD